MTQVVGVVAVAGHRLRLTFSDGTLGEASMRAKIQSFAPFRPLSDEALFRQAHVDEGTVRWPGGLDIAAEQLYALVHGLPEPTTLAQAEENERRARPSEA